jgi:hypothetical protein
MENLSSHSVLFWVGNLITDKQDPDEKDVQTGLADIEFNSSAHLWIYTFILSVNKKKILVGLRIKYPTFIQCILIPIPQSGLSAHFSPIWLMPSFLPKIELWEMEFEECQAISPIGSTPLLSYISNLLNNILIITLSFRITESILRAPSIQKRILYSCLHEQKSERLIFGSIQ